MTPQIANVVERLGRATGADRELDGLIKAAIDPPPSLSDELANIFIRYDRDDGQGVFKTFVGTQLAFKAIVPAYTSSIDAARTLGGLCVFASDIGADGLPMVKIVADTSTTPIIEHTGIAQTLERAWCIAALKARSQP